MNVVVDQLLTNYQSTGQGKLILLLHGWGDSAAGLVDLQKALSAKYQVVGLDLPGFGTTQAPKQVWDLDNYAEFLKLFLEKLELGRPFAVIGHSNGGALAIRAVSLGQLQPAKLILLAASGVRTSNKSKRLIFKTVAKIGKLLTFWLPERYRRGLRQRLYGVAGSDMLLAPHLQETFKRTVRQDVQRDAAIIKVPTLLIYAANDDAVPIADGKKYQSLIADSRLEIVENAGHFVHRDQPEEVTKLIEEFLA